MSSMVPSGAASDGLWLEVIEAGADPDRMAQCEALRHRIVTGKTGEAQSPPELAGWLATVHRSASVTAQSESPETQGIVGCMNIRSSRGRPFRLEQEFVLGPELDARNDLVEGSLYAVAAEHRGNGVAAALLMKALQRTAKRHGLAGALSTVIVPDVSRDPAVGAAALAYIRAHVRDERMLARPRDGYGVTLAGAATGEERQWPLMMRLLANHRSTLCAPPVYDPSDRSWDFLLLTRLS